VTIELSLTANYSFEISSNVEFWASLQTNFLMIAGTLDAEAW